MIDNKIFNTKKTDYEKPSLLLGSQELGLFDTVNKSYPEVWKLYKTMKSLDWDELEFNYSSCNLMFKNCPEHIADKMIKTLAFQWEADSVAAKTYYAVMAPFITAPELNAAWQRVSDNENIHAATYSEIVRMSFDNPRDVLKDVLSVSESIQRLSTASKIFSEGYKASHEYALGLRGNNQDTYNKAFMMVVAQWMLEAIQFMSSFAITFSICDTGIFQPIGKAVQKIAQDEFEVHVVLNREVVKHELTTSRGKKALSQNKQTIERLFDEIIDSEFAWNHYLFSDGEELVGINEKFCNDWTLYCSRDIHKTLGVETSHKPVLRNPLKFMNNWLDISKTQPAPQEQDNAQYKVGRTRRNDENKKFEVDF